ncbi:uncharacterized protein N7498_009803 [Penicillium cinerascens]|uniref:Phosphatidylinositol-specific phospholipase C X domain-containing protein n=1 Tax=Penicillium cinerascens TaxID=70096 RepID=A0A9W9J684_9EURO|nr:uncharacterized protein N7498_009803 [Penicillium cinerascens]KAJ5190818.1 hypothetical protein N7498_009803 [Penicillium cinerascens]
MVVKKLTIRNNTDTPINLKRLERFRAPGQSIGTDHITSLARNFTRVLTNQTRSEAPIATLSQADKPFDEQAELDIHIEAFTTKETDLDFFKESEKERLRLVFGAEGEEHTIQVPIPTSETATMKTVDNPKHRFTGVWVKPESFLAIYSSANLHAWMRELRDDTLLSSLSIPGTHNSPTCHVAPPSVRCQAVSPREQLRNGVRFFDIRVQPQYPQELKEDLILVHSVFPVSLTGTKYFRDLMNEVNDFLDKNPSETLIISLKREGPGDAKDEQLAQILHNHYAKDDNQRWWTRPKIPTLGEARGKVILLRRFNLSEDLKTKHDGHGWGLDGSAWADNTANANCPSGQLCIQDFYEVQEPTNIEQKIQYVKDHIDRASKSRYPFGDHPGPHPFFINFLSASNFWKTNTWPEKIAAKVNPAVVNYICRRHENDDGDSSTGILVTDWVGLDGDWDLVRCIVGMNAKLRLRQN